MIQGAISAAIDPRWIGIAVATAIVAVLIIILLIRRTRVGRPTSSAAPSAPAAAPFETLPTTPDPNAAPAVVAAAPATSSFLDQPLDKGFDGLGSPVSSQPALGTVVLPREMRAGGANAPAGDPLAPRPEAAAAPPMDMSMGMDMGSLSPAASPADEQKPPIDTPAPSGTQAAPAPAAIPDAATTPDSAATPDAAASGEPVVATPADAAAAPLSDIIVTTNKSEIDLTDPDVRAMLQELVRDEIALADVYRKGGQTLDAILQLTEAEKACQALGDADQAACIQTMLEELK